jgi:hypothetical protein
MERFAYFSTTYYFLCGFFFFFFFSVFFLLLNLDELLHAGFCGAAVCISELDGN